MFLVEALVNGFGGVEKNPEPSSENLMSTAYEIMAKSRGSIPLIPHDSGLPKSAPVLDFEALRQKNKLKIAERSKKRV